MAEMTDTSKLGFGRHSDIVLAVGLIGILGALIIPLPTIILDVLITLNFSYALLVMMVVLGVSTPLELSTFPSLLLLGTLFRLGLNVASTRLILLQSNAGQVIEAFGGFVVGGELVVGMVIFAILVVIQFVVITKGADRISEVVARFTLDAMPGKQMSIDADLNAGLIEGEEARRRRAAIVEEAEFYGSMDGASKYIRGDAIAGLIIIFINLIGGIVIGLTKGMSVTQAIQTYAHLTVGDGLVTQIPAVIMSTAAGVLVTKSASDEGLSQELGLQVLTDPRSLSITAAALFGFMLVPGLPFIPFMVLGTAMGGMAYFVHRQAQPEEPKEPEPDAEEPETEEESVRSLLAPERIAIEVGFGLISLVNPDEGGTLLERIKSLRKKFAREKGVLLPKIRIVDNMDLEGKQYHIKLSGHKVAEGEIYPDRLMAMKPGEETHDLEGIKTKEPSFGLPVVWIKPELKEEASLEDYTIVDPESVLITHLSEVLSSHAHEILSRQDVQELVENLEKSHPALVEDVIPDKLSIATLQQVLENLLEEGIPINDLARIVESCANNLNRTDNVATLTECVRKAVRWAICDHFSDSEDNLYALTLDPTLEDEIRRGTQQTDEGPILAPARLRRIGDVISENLREWNQGEGELVLMVSPELRQPVNELFGPYFPDVPILAYDEISEAVDLQTVDIIAAKKMNDENGGENEPEKMKGGEGARGDSGQTASLEMS